jgi:N-acetylglucosamine malate deacetylase 1
MKLDILAFGAHPDDVELGCSGTLFIEKLNGKKTGIIDLTQGELGTRGNATIRLQEASEAAKILNIDVRENLKLEDGFFENNKQNQLKVIEVIRKYKPEVILCNAPEDRHPDHGRGAALLYDAAFLSGLKKIETLHEGIVQDAWRPKYVFNYIQDRLLKADIIIDITNGIQQKIDSIKAYGTQFYNPNANEQNETYISTPQFFESVVARAAMFGKMIGVDYAEGFISKKAIGVQNFSSLVLKDT